MPKLKSGSFEISKLMILDESGKCDKTLMPKLTDEQIKEIYKQMILTRVFDEKAFKLQRQGRIGTYAPTKGQEASDIGSAFAMSEMDWIFPTYRNAGAFIGRGMPMEMIFQYWGGDEYGMKIPDNLKIFPLAIPVGTHLLHAVGFAWGAKKKNSKLVVVTYIGEGGTSTGDFHEAMNFAGIHKIPVVFIVENNQYAISVPKDKQTGSQTIAQKAIAYGFEGVQVDGNDVFAVFKATREALEKARKGWGPTLIECITYRMGDHTTADDASRYRPQEEVEIWKKKDPILRLERYMEMNGLWTRGWGEKVLAEAEEKVETAVKAFDALPKPKPDEFFDYVFKEQTRQLKEQKEYLKKLLEEKEKEVRFP